MVIFIEISNFLYGIIHEYMYVTKLQSIENRSLCAVIISIPISLTHSRTSPSRPKLL